MAIGYGIHKRKMRLSGNGLRWQQALWIAEARQRVWAEAQARRESEFDRRWDARQAKREAKRERARVRAERQARIEAANGDWRQEPATDRQIAYMRSLGVVVSDEEARELTKGRASQIIDAVKSGEGVGQFGMFMRDGSN